jgi:hypothetical protein
MSRGHFRRALSGINFLFEIPPVNAACALLLLFVGEAEAVAEAEADAAQCSVAGEWR